jgi:hypothetical protein
MKRSIFLAIFIVFLILISQLASAVEVKTDHKFGVASFYQEDGIVDSKWIGFFYEGLISIGHYDEEGLIGGAEIGFPVSARAEEEWIERGVEVQTNDMNLWGINTNFELGWAFPTIIVNDLEIGFAPLVGYGLSYFKLKRSNEEITRRITGVAVVDESQIYHHLDIGAKLYWFASDTITVNLKSMVGFIVYNESDNSQLGTLTGGNGYLVKMEGGIDYHATRDIVFNLDAFGEVRRIKGATSGNFTWLDTNFNTFGGKLGVKYIF